MDRSHFVRTFIWLVVICTCLPSLSSADEPFIITAQMRTDDANLNKRVSLSTHRAYVGEVVESLAAATGVSIKADDRDGASDAVIAVFLRNAPVGDVMNALWSFFSYRGGTWAWRRDSAGGKYLYTLHRPRSAQVFAETFVRSIQDSFEDEAEAYRDALQLSPSELKKRAKQDPRLSYLLDSPRGRAGLQTFFEALPQSLQLAVLRGEAKPRVAVSNLSPAGQQFVRDAWKNSSVLMRQPDGSTSTAPLPSWIAFDGGRDGWTVSPSLFIHMENLGGFGYCGGAPLERATRQRLAKLWLQPGDSLTSVSGNVIVQSPGPDAPVLHDDNTMRIRLQHLADCTPVSIIARVPRKSQDVTDPGEPYKERLSAFLHMLETTDPHYLVKWREGVLLVDSPTWIYEENHAPWRIVRAIRQSRAGLTGRFALADIISVAGTLNEEEMKSLADEFPVMSGAAGWHDLLSAMSRSRALYESITSTKGMPIEMVLNPLRRITALSLTGVLDRDLAGARVFVEEVVRDGVPGIQLTIRGRDGGFIRGIGFVNRGSKPTLPADASPPGP